MTLQQMIKEIARGKNHARDLDLVSAETLYRQMLAGDIPELELGAILVALRVKGEAETEMLGFYRALQERVIRLTAPAGKPMPIVIPSYNGARKHANLTPLLAMLLSELGFPVVVHGVSHDPTRITSETLFNSLDIPAATDMLQAQKQLESGRVVFLSSATFCPALDKQLALRWRMGVRNSAHSLAKVLTPFADATALRITSISHPEYHPRIISFFQSIAAPALLLNGTEGEVYANPRRTPKITLIQPDNVSVISAPEQGNDVDGSDMWSDKSVSATVSSTLRCLNRELPVPEALRLQIASCYVACGRSDTIEQAFDAINCAGY
ncbi:MAG: putative protein YbiB [Candidatus Erwinia impunctatus]|nr:putative protein YbiB [Culicoides impunctatus]